LLLKKFVSYRLKIRGNFEIKAEKQNPHTHLHHFEVNFNNLPTV